MLFRVTESVTQIVNVACSALVSLSLTNSALHKKRMTETETVKSAFDETPKQCKSP